MTIVSPLVFHTWFESPPRHVLLAMGQIYANQLISIVLAERLCFLRGFNDVSGIHGDGVFHALMAGAVILSVLEVDLPKIASQVCDANCEFVLHERFIVQAIRCQPIRRDS